MPLCAIRRHLDRDGSLTRCFNYDNDAALDLESLHRAISVGPEAHDGAPSPPNALVIRLPASASSDYAAGSHRVFYAFVAKTIEISASVKQIGASSDLSSLFGVRRDDVSAYIVVDTQQKWLTLAEQDQRDGRLVNAPLPASIAGVDLTSWTRIHLKLDLVAGSFSFRVEGRPEELVGSPMNWPQVAASGRVYFGRTYFTNNTAPVSIHFDDVIVRVN